ncbi:MAG TPA: MATE family efflux transporter [Ruminococcaceae bacterium]|nr:MATE family efflux transporter [Oscillospiraceae bacterium]
MTNGPLLGKVLLFSLPLMLSGILQLLYNAADIVVVGRYCGNTSLAAVGSTGALVALIINVFVGLSIGAGVTVANRIGANDRKGVHDAVHTAVAVSLISGVVCGLIGVTLSRTFLVMMGTPSNVLDLSSLYLKIYFAGMPALMFYNFGSAILRAMGDTLRPLYFLTASGLINVALNLLFVRSFHMDVAGVGLATVISQILSAVLVLLCLLRIDGVCRLFPKDITIRKKELFEIIRIGVPAGLQGAMFSISNVIIQSSINTYGSVVMAGNAACANIEGFTYTSMNSVHQAAVTFTSQNVGAKKTERISRVFLVCFLTVTVIGMFMGGISYLFRNPLLSLYSKDPAILPYGALRMRYICFPYFLCGMLDVIVGMIRGMGQSTAPMIVTVFGTCLLRVVWIYTVYKANPILEMIYITYPISWIVTALIQIVCYRFVKKRLIQKLKAKEEPAPAE